jgi:hypothetical protein
MAQNRATASRPSQSGSSVDLGVSAASVGEADRQGGGADKNAGISSKTARAFREELQPMSGALYDERAYKLVR